MSKETHRITYEHHRRYRIGGILVLLSRDAYNLQRDHFDYLNSECPGLVELLPYGGVTVAMLHDPETGRVVARGRANCSLRDRYCKEDGRVVSRRRALQAAGLWHDGLRNV